MKVVAVTLAAGPDATDAAAIAVDALRGAGADVHLVARAAPAPDVAGQCSQVTVLTGLPRPVALPGRLDRLRIDPGRLPAAWRLARHPGAARALDVAEVLVALDEPAVPAVWWAARSRPALRVVSGLAAATGALTAISAAG